MFGFFTNCDKNKEENNFNVLYREHKISMYKLCLRYMRTVPEAEDMLQEGFIKVFSNLDKYDDTKSSLSTWMSSVFVNTCIDQLRKNTAAFKEGGSLEISEIMFDINNNLELEIMSKLEMEQLMKIILEIPHGYRTVFNLYVIEGYSHKEIAKLLKISESTSKTQLFKAKKKIQKLIFNYFGEYIPKYARG